MKHAAPLFLLACLLCSFQFCGATITVTSVNVTTSTCPNNGTATIHATSTRDNALFLYNVVSGPVTYPQQNDSTFSSLYPGTYVAWVHDINSYDSTEVGFTITGNYQSPEFSAVATAPFCENGNDGKIYCSLDATTGLSPFTWQVISPFVGIQQQNDTFNNLAPANYSIKVTDACGVAQTNSVTLDSGGSGLAFCQWPIMDFPECNTAVISVLVFLNTNPVYHSIKVSTSTSSGTVVKNILPALWGQVNGLQSYNLVDTLTNLNYGDYLKICVTDTCNKTICWSADTVALFAFQLSYQRKLCSAGLSANVYFPSAYQYGNYIPVYLPYNPFTVILRNLNSGTIVDSFIYFDTCGLVCPTIPPQSDTTNYQLEVKDNCGNVYQQFVQWPGVPAPSVSTFVSSNSCLDSTSNVEFSINGLNVPYSVELLSGPTGSQSSRPGFAYRDTIVYPILYVPSGYSAMGNMPAGTYTYKVSDNCGNFLMGSFIDSITTNLNFSYQIQKSCGGRSNLTLGSDTINANYELTTIGTNTFIPPTHIGDSIFIYQSLNPGRYLVSSSYFELGIDELLPGNNYCWTRLDTLIIPLVDDSTLKATDVATCNGDIYIHIDVDSNNGVLPFHYEIISGPETFTAQDSNIFEVHNYGTYLIGVIDACGNVDTRQITIDTGRFEPVIRTGGLCVGGAAQLAEVASPYFSYVWKRPNGTIFTGDTLNIYPLTNADTGIYQITKIVTINNCRDSAFGSYRLIFSDTFQRSATLCGGDTLFVGQYPHTTSGVYFDTLTGAYGCDSIVVSTLNLLPTPVAAIRPITTPICHTSPITLTATGGTVYIWSNTANSEAIVVNPTAITTYAVTVTDTTLCSATASITVYPISDTAISLSPTKASICSGDTASICAPTGFTSYRWNNGDSTECLTTTKPGNYAVTATNSLGCPAVSDTAHIMVFSAIAPVSIIRKVDTLVTNNLYSSYQWYESNASLAGDTSANLVTNSPGNYTVQVTDSNGCPGTSNVLVLTGVNNIGVVGHINVYPNPNYNGNRQVEVSPQLVGSTCQVFDAEGKLVYSATIKSTQSTISIKAASGMYVMQISSATATYNIKLVQF